MLKVITKNDRNDEEKLTLDSIARMGARKMLQKAIEGEVLDYLALNADERDEEGHRLVVRNGKGRPRQIAFGVGKIEISVPRVLDRRAGEKFTSTLLPPYMRRSPQLSEALPVLYLKGISCGDFSEALAGIMGEQSGGFSASVISRLKNGWEAEYIAWSKRPLAGKEYVYVWADGIHVGVRLGDDKSVCLLVLVGATANGEKELIAVFDGYRESKESWLGLLRDLLRRGLKAPLIAVGDGALGFWGAVDEVYPATKHQRCWIHKVRNILNYLPKRLQEQAKARLDEIQNADTREDALEGIKRFAGEYGAKHPKAVECLEKDVKELLAFYDFPAEHWGHLRTTNPIESTFATVRLRTYKTKGAGSRTMALTMAFKLLESAEKRWRKINAPYQAKKLAEGIKFTDGIDLTSSKRVAA
jgi:transposase-like protein